MPSRFVIQDPVGTLLNEDYRVLDYTASDVPLENQSVEIVVQFGLYSEAGYVVPAIGEKPCEIRRYSMPTDLKLVSGFLDSLVFCCCADCRKAFVEQVFSYASMDEQEEKYVQEYQNALKEVYPP